MEAIMTKLTQDHLFYQLCLKNLLNVIYFFHVGKQTRHYTRCDGT